MIAEAPVDLDAYFLRIGYSGVRTPTASTLRALHLAHTTHIPFENLDVLLGRPIQIDLNSIQAKLVVGQRGGYCFEQNALFAAALEQLGFQVTRIAGRARHLTTRVLPRTPTILNDDADGHPWVADVGFGGYGLLEAIPLKVGEEFQQFAWKYRLCKEGEQWVLQSFNRAEWRDQYCFTLEPQLPIDYTLGNWFCSTHPESRFVQTLTAQLPGPTERRVLRNREYVIVTPEGERAEIISSEEALLQVLAKQFGLRMPPGTRFKPTMI